MDTSDASSKHNRQEVAQEQRANSILDGFLSEEKTADQLDKSVRTLKRWRSQRKGPPWVTVGRDVYYSIDGTRQWLLSRQTKPVRAA